METSDVSPKQTLRFYVYILLSLKDNGFYIGYTTNLTKRFYQHSKGQVESTQRRRPFTLIHYEYFVSKKDAKARETFLKSGYGRKQMKQFLKDTLEKL